VQWIIFAIKGPNFYPKNEIMLVPMPMKCKKFLNMIIAQSPTLAQCPSYFLFDVPTSNEETYEKLLDVKLFFFNVDIVLWTSTMVQVHLWFGGQNMLIVPNVVFFYQQIFIILVSQIGTHIIRFMVRILISL
jgi:hypothetical protein